MKKIKRLLSALTALTITASAFAGMVIPASAEGDSIEYDGTTVTINADASYTSATLIRAAYDGNVLSGVSTYTVPLANGVGMQEIEDLDNGNVLMAWDSLGGMKPIAEPVSVSGLTFAITQDFENITDSWGFEGAAGAKVVDGVLNLCDDTTADKTTQTIKTMPSNVVNKSALNIKFDWASRIPSDKDRSSGLELRASDGALLFAIYGKGSTRNDTCGIKYATSEEDGAINWQNVENFTGDYYAVDLSVNFMTEKINGTISKGDSVLVTISDASIDAKNFEKMVAGNYYSAAPMSIDNVEITAPDLKDVELTVKGGENGETAIANAKIIIGSKTFVTNADGVIKIALPQDTYQVSVTATGHNVKSQEIIIGANTTSIEIVLEYVGLPEVAKVEISGGSEDIYKPKNGSNKTAKFSAKVYDQTNQLMNSEEVEWSIAGGAEGATISVDGIVTVTSDFPVVDDNGETIVVKATSKTKDSVSATANIHVYNVARATTFDIIGPATIKDGIKATYTIGNVKDQYGVEYKGDATYTLSSTAKDVTIDGMDVTPNTGTVQTKDFEITATSSDVDNQGINTKTTKIITAYAFDFYESQIGGSSYGTVRTSEVAGTTYTVWPASQTANATQKITLPVPVALTAGSAKMITYSTAWTNKKVGSQERFMTIDISSENANDIVLGYQDGDVYLDPAKVDKNFTGGTSLGTQSGTASTFEETLIILKTDTDGKTTATISFAGGDTVTKDIGTNVGSITDLIMYGGKGVPDDRLFAIKDIKISDSDIAEVEISGAAQFAKVEGKTASKKYTASVFSQIEGETFAWSATDASRKAISGVSISDDGVLSVEDTVAADTKVIVAYTSNADATKKAEKEVTIKDFATVTTFTINGPAAVNAGDEATYSVSKITDEYGDIVDMTPSYTITTGSDIASIDAQTGVLTTDTSKTGKITVSVEVGNTGKKKILTQEVIIGKYSISGSASANVDVNISELAYTSDKYLVTTATELGVLVNQDEVAPSNGIVTVDMAGAAKYEVSPIYSYTNVGNVANGFTIPVPDGSYDFTFKKSNGSRGDILVNGNIVGQNVDQTAKQRSNSGATYSVKDVKVDGGTAVVSMRDGDTNLSSIKVTKAPSILPRKTHVFLAGDSTMANYIGAYANDVELINDLPKAGQAQTGWGQVFEQFLADDMNVTNLAESGNYAMPWYNASFNGVTGNAEAGDYFLISFTINDKSYANSPGGGTDNMINAMTAMIDECREIGVIPVLVNEQRTLQQWPGSTNGWEGYYTAVRQLAVDKDVLFVDLTNLSGDYFTEKGNDFITKNHHIYYSGAPQDAVHLSYFGAMKCVELVIQDIVNQQAVNKTTASGESFANIHVDTDKSYTFTLNDGTTTTLKVNAAN